MFTDTPTRVAPLPVQEALGVGATSATAPTRSASRRRCRKPMPFHSDADEFPEEAFEEATKVRALDELVAQTADSEDAATAGRDEELAARRRADATVSDPVEDEGRPERAPSLPDRDSAPVLPSPPEPEARTPKLLDATPSPRMDAPAEKAAPAETTSPAEKPAPSTESAAKTRLGIEPARVPTRPSAAPPVAKESATRPTGPRAAEKAEKAEKPVAAPPAPRSSAAPLIIFLLLLIAGGAAAVWFFVLRDKAVDAVAVKPTAGSGTTTPKGSGSASAGSDASGSAVAMAGSAGSDASGSAGGEASGSAGGDASGSAGGEANGSAGGDTSGSAGGDTSGSAEVAAGSAAGSAGSAATTEPTGLVDAVIGSNVPKASIEVLGTPFRGAAPLRAKLERGKPYRARVQAPGFVPQEIVFKGGDARPFARLVAKPRSIEIASDPSGAMIFIDNANSGFTTPHTLELTAGQLGRKSVRVTLRKNGHKPVERVLTLDSYTDAGNMMTAKVDEKLPVQTQAPTPTPTPTPTGGSGATTGAGGSGGDAAGSASTGDGPKPSEPEPEFIRTP